MKIQNMFVIFFLLATCNQMLAQKREPLPQDLQLARKRYALAKKEEKAAKEAASTAMKRESALQEKLAQSVESDKRFENLMAKYDDLAKEVTQKYCERAKWISPPPGWVAQKKELRRRWEILAPHRRHVEDNFWKSIDGELRRVTKELQEWGKKSEQKKRSINRQIRALKKRRKLLDRQLASAAEIRLDDRLAAQWTIALANIGKANKRIRKAEKEVLAAFDHYLQIATKLGPSHDKEVKLLSGNDIVYWAKWRQLHPKTNKELDEEQASLLRKAYRKKIREVESQISYIDFELEANSEERYKLAKEMTGPTRRLEAAAQRYGEALLHKVYAQVAIESATVVVEVALTGGTATLARKSAELAERALQKSARRTLVKHLDRATYKAAVSKASYRAAMDNIDETLKSVVLWRRRYVKEAVKRAQAKARASGKDVLRAGNKARKQAEKLCDKIQIAVKRKRKISNSEWRKLKGPELEKWINETRKGIHEVSANAISRKVATAGILKMTGTPNSENPVAKEVYSVALGEALEGFVGTMVIPAIGEGIKGFRETAGQGTWQKLKAGMTRGRKFYNVTDVKKSLFSRGSLVGVVGAVTKTLATSHYATKANRANLDFWSTYAKLTAMYRIYYESLSADYKLWRHQQRLKKLVAADKAIHSSLLWKRRLVVKKSSVLKEGKEAGKCIVTFSTPLTAAPQVALGDIPIRMKAQGSQVSGQSYVGTFSRDSLPKSQTTLALSIKAASTNLPFAHIDGNPATPAYLPLIGRDFKGFEKRPDTNYKIRIKGSGAEKEAKSTLIDQQKFTKVSSKYIFKKHPVPEIKNKKLPPFKGRLAVLYRDSSGKYSSVHKSIHRVGDKRSLLGTWNQVIEMTPGTYDIYATGPTPAIRASSITVQRGRTTKVQIGGYGRLRTFCRNGLGEKTSSNMVIKRAGAKEAILSTWTESLELAPGNYDIFFTSYEPDIAHRNFVIKRGFETKVETYGYGRVSLSMKDGLGKETDSNIVVRKSGSDKNLLSTWQKVIDLPPDSYDIFLTSYEPDMAIRGVQVRKHQQTKALGSGYGRISLSMKDGLGKETSSNIVVRSSGSDKSIHSTWQKNIDLPPGSYDIFLTSYEPDMAIRGVQVRKHQQTKAIARGYGRIFVDCRDRAGNSSSVHIAVHRAGQKNALLGTWSSKIDLPPGLYDLHFSTGGDGKWARAVTVRSKSQTNVRVRR